MYNGLSQIPEKDFKKPCVWLYEKNEKTPWQAEQQQEEQQAARWL